MLTRALTEGRHSEKSGPGDAGATLTRVQKNATVQKWADWILKQRQAAKSGLPAGNRARGAAG
ncbi:MAG TPA: hypothetical protein VF767_01830 [Bryobacteraceae bacterium]